MVMIMIMRMMMMMMIIIIIIKYNKCVQCYTKLGEFVAQLLVQKYNLHSGSKFFRCAF